MFSPLEQIEPAVDLGAVPPPLPEILKLRDFAAAPPVTPPQIIEGILHQGCKMILHRQFLVLPGRENDAWQGFLSRVMLPPLSSPSRRSFLANAPSIEEPAGAR